MTSVGLRLCDLTVGQQLKVRRVALGLKQRELGALVGVSEASVCRAEKGGRGSSPAVVGRLDDVLRGLEQERPRSPRVKKSSERRG